ncbi:MAG TPA: KH domain-containing protein [Candidatus Cloacimonetes bacterium]|nr:KH domain-containing protein [Candidatus Cloacimonadota bacterium]
MKIIEKEGKSTSKIIAEFMEEHNLKLEDFKFEVIEKGSSGFLNIFGAKPTKIRFILPDIADDIKVYTEQLLKHLTADYESVVVNFKDNTYFIKISSSKNPGYLIGKEAKLLDSIQHIINQMINKKEKKQVRIQVDVNDYRQKRKKALINKVTALKDKVAKRGKSITLEPLDAANRKIVHKIIEKDKQLKTMTIGDGEFKRVVILPPTNDKKPPVKEKKVNDGKRKPRYRSRKS